MSYRYQIQEEENLLVIVFRGAISYEEEVQAVVDTLADTRLRPDARILADKTGAQMRLGPGDVEPHIELLERNLARLGRPKVANVVSRDADFGMVRMFEMRAENRIDHDFMVFRALDEACTWLGVDPAEIEWP